MTIEQHLKIVLQEQNKVYVAGLGRFWIEQQRATLRENSKDSMSLLAPTQKIVFEDTQTDAENGLAQRIAENENKSLEQAQNEILTFSESLRNTLQTSGKIELLDVGTLSFVHQTLHFESNPQSSLLSDSFGLPDFEFPLLKRKLNLNRWAKYLSILVALLVVSALIYWKIQAIPISNARISSDTLKIYSPKDSTTRQTVRYSIVVGSFASQTNAQLLKNKLIKDGYTPEIQEVNNLYRVLLNTFSEPLEAQHQLELFLEKNKNLSVWVLLSR